MTSTKHIVVQSIEAWGHLKPMLGIAARIADARPDIIITVLTSSISHTKIVREIARVSKHGDRFRIVDIRGTPSIGFELSIPEFGPAFEALWKGGDITCKTTGDIISDLPRPTAVIFSLMLYSSGQAVRTIAGKKCAVVMFLPPSANSMLRLAPEELGGMGDIRAKIEARVAAGENPIEAGNKVWYHAEGKVMETPGLPPMFDYELFPQEVKAPTGLMIQDVPQFMHLADSAFIPSSNMLEKDSLSALRTWLASLGTELWTVGMPSPPDVLAIGGAASASAEDQKTLAFLDRIHKSHGAKSLVYISFGSMFWPSDPSRLWAVVEELLSSKTPFLFAQASPKAIMPAVHSQAIEASEISMVAPWVPQDAVLAHPATGWFLTHGGWNSTQEGILAKVPMIFYPIQGDQPGNAALMSVSHEAAFELLSVRTWIGEKVPYRCRDGPAPDFSEEGARNEMRILLERMKREEGRKIRENMEHLGEAYGRMWEEGGEAKINLENFLRKHVD